MMRFLRRISWVLLTVLVVVLANLNMIVSYLLPDPLYYPYSPFKLDRTMYGPNDPIIVFAERCNTQATALPVITARNLINIDNGDNIPLPSTTILVQPGCHRIEASLNPLGTYGVYIPTGTYKFQSVSTARTKIKTVDAYWESTTFYYNTETR